MDIDDDDDNCFDLPENQHGLAYEAWLARRENGPLSDEQVERILGRMAEKSPLAAEALAKMKAGK